MKIISTFASILLMFTLSATFRQTPKPTSTAPKAVTALTGKPASSTKAVSTTAPIATKASSTTATPSTTKASTTPMASTPVQSTGPNLSLKNLITQALRDDSSRTAKKAGTIGLGLRIISTGVYWLGLWFDSVRPTSLRGLAYTPIKPAALHPLTTCCFMGVVA